MENVDEIFIVVESPKKVVSFKLDVDIIAQIDEVWPRLGYRSRSQFLREAVLFYLQYVQKRLREHKEAPVEDETSINAADTSVEDVEGLVSELKSLVQVIAAKQLTD